MLQSQQQQQQDNKEIYCGKHKENRITGICFNKSCINKNQVCFICMKDHVNHYEDIIEIHTFQNFIINLSDQDYQQQQKNNDLLNQLLNLKKQLTTLLETINIKIDNIESLLIKQCNTTEEIQEMFKKVQPMIEVKQNTIKLSNKRFKPLYESTTLKVHHMTLQTSNLIKIAKHLEEHRQIQLEFCDKNKNPSIAIENSRIAKPQQKVDLGFVYGKDIINLRFYKVQFAFNIKSLNDKIMIGMGVASTGELLKKCQMTGHKQYLIASNGYIYHHSDETINNQKRGFKFQENSIINISYDPKEKLLTFHQYKTDNKIIMAIKEMGDQLSPVAVLTGVKDVVELIDYVQ